LFNVCFDVLLYDLTSTYFESDPPLAEDDKRQHGYSRDHRPDCVQIVIALVVTPEGLPLRLAELQTMKLTRDALLMKLGSAQTKAPAAWRLIDSEVNKQDGTLTY
jgi:hypothetical protein